jgi:hypothetical protein
MMGAGTKSAADFKAIWDKFKVTRDNETIPAICKGRVDDAKTIARGIQSARLFRMWSIMPYLSETRSLRSECSAALKSNRLNSSEQLG